MQIKNRKNILIGNGEKLNADNMDLKEFLLEWKQYGFKVASGNWLIGFTKWYTGAKKIILTFRKNNIRPAGRG